MVSRSTTTVVYSVPVGKSGMSQNKYHQVIGFCLAGTHERIPARHDRRRLRSGLVRFHIRAEQRVDPRLIPRPLCLEPIQDLTIQTNGHRCLWLGKPEHRTFEEGFTLLRNIGSVDLLLLE